MTKRSKAKLDPLQIFLHAGGFLKATHFLDSLDMDTDTQVAMEIAQPSMVLSALNSELFLKCLICIEKGKVPRGHHLDSLFAELSSRTRARIQEIWDTELVPLRNPMWLKVEENLGKKIRRDLPGALASGSKAFEKIRYSYENDNEEMEFYISDLPKILVRIVLELKPEWMNVQRTVQRVARSTA